MMWPTIFELWHLRNYFSRLQFQWSDPQSSSGSPNYWPDYKGRLLTGRSPHHKSESWERAGTQIFRLNIAIFRGKISRLSLRALISFIKTSCQGHLQGGSQHGLLPPRRCLPHRSVKNHQQEIGKVYWLSSRKALLHFVPHTTYFRRTCCKQDGFEVVWFEKFSYRQELESRI